jgi:hypothetical protein
MAKIVEGDKELIDLLTRKLPAHLGVKLLKDVNKEGAKVFQVEMKARVHPSFVKYVRLGASPTNKTGIMVGIHSDGYVMRFLEYGTKVRYAKLKSGKKAHRGQNTPNPMIQPAIERSVEPAIKAIFENLSQSISNFLKRNAKKIKK